MTFNGSTQIAATVKVGKPMLSILLTILNLIWSARNLSRWSEPPMPAAPPAPVVVPSVALPAEIRSALLANAASLGPQVTARWERSRTSAVTLEQYRKREGEHTAPFEAELNLRGTDSVNLEWQADGKYREEWRQAAVDPKTNKPTTRWNRVYTFDGELFFDHGMNPNEARSLSTISPAEIETMGDGYYSRNVQLGYFYACGLKLPVQHAEIAKKDGVSSTILNLIATGAALRSVEPITRDGVPLTRLTLQAAGDLTGGSIYEALMLDAINDSATTVQTVLVDLDPALNDAVRHLEFRDAADKLLVTDDCADFDSYPGHAVWLPKRCTISEFADGAKEAETTTNFDLKLVTFDLIAKPHFTLEEHQPGAWIIEHEDTNQKKISLVQKDGSLKPWKK